MPQPVVKICLQVPTQGSAVLQTEPVSELTWICFSLPTQRQISNWWRCTAYCCYSKCEPSLFLLHQPGRKRTMWIFFDTTATFIWRHLLCLARLGTSTALEKHPHPSACMSRTWRLVVARLLDNLKWNNSARRAQTRVGVCASAKGVRAWKVFLTSRNVNNSPSTVHINFPTGGRRKGAEGETWGRGGWWWREGGVNARGREGYWILSEPESVAVLCCCLK